MTEDSPTANRIIVVEFPDSAALQAWRDSAEAQATAIRRYFDDWLKQRLQKTTINLSDARNVDPKTIWAYGTWGGDIPGQNGSSPTHVGGTWTSVSVQDGAEWKLRVDTWNMMPPPVTTTAAK